MESVLNYKDKNCIETKLISIFKTKFNINFQEEYKTFIDEHLMGKKIKLMPRDLVYLLKCIEKEFNIIIPEEEIVKGKFSSFNNLVLIIYKQINLRNALNEKE